jgi:sugar phosphate isomerase/epimerase
MKIGISTLFYLKHDFSLLIKKLKIIKLEYIELVDEGLHSLNSKRIKTIKNINEENKQIFTVNFPFVDVNIASPFTSVRRAVLTRLIKSIKLSSELGAKLWIFHPGLKTGISHIYPWIDWKIQLE